MTRILFGLRTKKIGLFDLKDLEKNLKIEIHVCGHLIKLTHLFLSQKNSGH